MSIVYTSGVLVHEAVVLCTSIMQILSSSQKEIQHKYKNAESDWRDSKYQQLGDIVNECNNSIKKTLYELGACFTALRKIEQHIEEYEGIDFFGNKVTVSEAGFLIQSSNQVNTDKPTWRNIVGDHDSLTDLKATNLRYNEGRQWQINCQRCVPTYEMRRRGYDVTAKPNKHPGDHLSYYPFDVWINANQIHCSGSGLSEIQSTMNSWGDGCRSQIVIYWRSGGGHTFFAELVNGSIKFYDPQTNESDVEYYFDSAKDGCTELCRIDNLEQSERILECCEEAGRND